ncbi:hypothetical protein DSO57_1025880, partial [Entomophthora muscae]
IILSPLPVCDHGWAMQILWWALPTQSITRQFPNASKPTDQGWFPDTDPEEKDYADNTDAKDDDEDQSKNY